MARLRDYAAEYARRIASGLRRGLSRSQARGHPRRTERLISEPTHRQAPQHRPAADERVYNALERMEKGASLEQAAKAEHISPEKLRRVAFERGYLSKDYSQSKRGDWRISTSTTRPVLTADRRYLEQVVFDLRNTSAVSRYWNAVGRLLDDGDPEPLTRLGPLTVRGVDGTTYELQTDHNAIIGWWLSLTEQERRTFARQFGSERVTVRRGRAA
jgi:hypothetical protein